jgi:hypothetical protein
VLAGVGAVMAGLQNGMHGGEVEAVAAREGAELVLGGGGDGGDADEAGVGEGLGDDGREVGEVERDVAAAKVREERRGGRGGAQAEPEPAQLVDLLADLAAGAADRREAVVRE